MADSTKFPWENGPSGMPETGPLGWWSGGIPDYWANRWEDVKGWEGLPWNRIDTLFPLKYVGPVCEDNIATGIPRPTIGHFKADFETRKGEPREWFLFTDPGDPATLKVPETLPAFMELGASGINKLLPDAIKDRPDGLELFVTLSGAGHWMECAANRFAAYKTVMQALIPLMRAEYEVFYRVDPIPGERSAILVLLQRLHQLVHECLLAMSCAYFRLTATVLLSYDWFGELPSSTGLSGIAQTIKTAAVNGVNLPFLERLNAFIEITSNGGEDRMVNFISNDASNAVPASERYIVQTFMLTQWIFWYAVYLGYTHPTNTVLPDNYPSIPGSIWHVGVATTLMRNNVPVQDFLTGFITDTGAPAYSFATIEYSPEYWADPPSDLVDDFFAMATKWSFSDPSLKYNKAYQATRIITGIITAPLVGNDPEKTQQESTIYYSATPPDDSTTSKGGYFGLTDAADHHVRVMAIKSAVNELYGTRVLADGDSLWSVYLGTLLQPLGSLDVIWNKSAVVPTGYWGVPQFFNGQMIGTDNPIGFDIFGSQQQPPGYSPFLVCMGTGGLNPSVPQTKYIAPIGWPKYLVLDPENTSIDLYDDLTLLGRYQYMGRESIAAFGAPAQNGAVVGMAAYLKEDFKGGRLGVSVVIPTTKEELFKQWEPALPVLKIVDPVVIAVSNTESSENATNVDNTANTAGEDLSEEEKNDTKENVGPTAEQELPVYGPFLDPTPFETARGRIEKRILEYDREKDDFGMPPVVVTPEEEKDLVNMLYVSMVGLAGIPAIMDTITGTVKGAVKLGMSAASAATGGAAAPATTMM